MILTVNVGKLRRLRWAGNVGCRNGPLYRRRVWLCEYIRQGNRCLLQRLHTPTKRSLGALCPGMAQQERKAIHVLYLLPRLRVRGTAPVPLIRRNSEPYLMKPIDIYTITNLVLKSTISVPYGSKRVLFKVILRFFLDKKKNSFRSLNLLHPA